jgi:hypothetical protein
MTRRQRKYLFAVGLAVLVGLVAPWFLGRMGAVGGWASGDTSPEITIGEEQDELSFELKSTPRAKTARRIDTRQSYSDASQPAAASEPGATAEPDALAGTTAENLDQDEHENSSDGGRMSPVQFAPLAAYGWSGVGPAGAGSSFGMGAGARPSLADGSGSLAGNNGEIPKETASTARVGRTAAKDSSQPTASPGGNRPQSNGAVPLFTDEDLVAAVSLDGPGSAEFPVAADSFLEATFVEEPSPLPPPAPPLRANPEPASLLLLATGLGLAARQLQRRTKASRQA